jgi:16S rRNA (cytidine1402-2'-O)-methyltransferase
MNVQKKGTLYLIPTPLSDDQGKSISPEVMEVVTSLDNFLVENVRTARRFISSLNTGKVIENISFNLLDKNTPPDTISALMKPVMNGMDIGVMSEAGCPGIADPGNLAVQFAHQYDIRVVPLTGPSSIFMSLMASGFNGQSFVFHGYLPINKNERVQSIKKIEKNALQLHQTQIFMETPYRNNQLVADLIKSCSPSTKLCIARDITGGQEMIRTKRMHEWKKSIPDLHKIPVIFLIYGD